MPLRVLEGIDGGSKPVGVSLHIGAFATSALGIQSFLKSRRDHLERHGVCYLGPDQLRGEAGLVFPSGRENRTPTACGELNAIALNTHVQKHLERHPLHHLILSDGALLGSARRLTVEGKLYPDAILFLSALPKWIDAESTTVFLSIRNLGDLISEKISRVAMRRRIPDISRIEKVLRTDLDSWHSVIARVQSHFEKSKMTIWRHEDFTKVADPVVMGLTKGVLQRFDRELTPQSLSARALEYMSEYADDSGKIDIPFLRLKYAMKHFPVSAKYPIFSIGGAALKDHIRAGYKCDWTKISGTWPDAVLLPR